MMRFFLEARVLGAYTLVATAGMACGHDGPDPGHSADTGSHDSGSDGAGDDADVDDGMAYEPCTLGLLRCDGSCVDPETDLANCGACGATCEGTCERSRCTVQLASQPGQLLSLSLDDTHVYWRNAVTRAISRVAKQGGAVEEVYLDPIETPGALIASDGFVYTSLGERIVRIPSTGGAAEDLAAGSVVLAVSAEDVYFNTSAIVESEAFARVPTQGGTPTVIVADDPAVAAAVIRGDTLTFLAAAGLFSTPLKGTSPQPLATGVPGGAFAIDDSHVYFAYGGGDSSPYTGRMPRAGGAVEVLAMSYLLTFGIDDTHLYGGGFPMVRIPLAGGTVEDLGRPGINVLKVEPHAIYWVETTPGVSFVNMMSK